MSEAQMRIRLNRWQQIGVVLSMLAFVGIGIYAWVFEARRRDEACSCADHHVLRYFANSK